MTDHFPEKLPSFTQHTLADLPALKAELGNIREAGIAYDREEYSLGLACVACPIFDRKGQAAFAVSVSAPTYRMTAEHIQHIGNQLRETARQISRQLGY